MQSRKITAAVIVTLGMMMAGNAVAAEPDAPVFGGWRNLHSASGAEPVLRNQPFAILPGEVAKGERFAILDRENKQAVCCLVVDSDRLDAIALETRYRLLVATSVEEAKHKAKVLRDASWFKPHTDALLEVDDCIAIDQVGGRYVQLERGEHQGIALVSDYIVIG